MLYQLGQISFTDPTIFADDYTLAIKCPEYSDFATGINTTLQFEILCKRPNFSNATYVKYFYVNNTIHEDVVNSIEYREQGDGVWFYFHNLGRVLNSRMIGDGVYRIKIYARKELNVADLESEIGKKQPYFVEYMPNGFIRRTKIPKQTKVHIRKTGFVLNTNNGIVSKGEFDKERRAKLPSVQKVCKDLDTFLANPTQSFYDSKINGKYWVCSYTKNRRKSHKYTKLLLNYTHTYFKGSRFQGLHGVHNQTHFIPLVGWEEETREGIKFVDNAGECLIFAYCPYKKSDIYYSLKKQMKRGARLQNRNTSLKHAWNGYVISVFYINPVKRRFYVRDINENDWFAQKRRANPRFDVI